MPVKLRLARHGKKRNPHYRLVAANSDARRDGRFLEMVGSYDPVPGKPLVALKRERIQYWLDQGAQPTKTVKSLLDTWMTAEDSVRKPRQRPVFTPAPKAEAAPPKAAAPKAVAAPEAVAAVAAPEADAVPAAAPEADAAPAAPETAETAETKDEA
jgi:small subunit ribosomal protein S16